MKEIARKKGFVSNRQRKAVMAKFKLPPLKMGTLGGTDFFSKPQMSRRQKEIMIAQRIGEKRTSAKLRAIALLNKNRNPKLSQKAANDARFISGSFKRKEFVGFPKGFGSNPWEEN